MTSTRRPSRMSLGWTTAEDRRPLHNSYGGSFRPRPRSEAAQDGWEGPLRIGRRRGPKTAKTKGIFRQTKRKVSRRGAEAIDIIEARNWAFRAIVCFQGVDRLFVSP